MIDPMKNNKKTGVQPIGRTEKLYSRFVLWEVCENQSFPSCISGNTAAWKKYKGRPPKSRHRGFQGLFSTLILAVFGASGKIMGTSYQLRLETLLAVMGAALAYLVILPPAILPQEEEPFQPPFASSGRSMTLRPVQGQAKIPGEHTKKSLTELTAKKDSLLAEYRTVRSKTKEHEPIKRYIDVLYTGKAEINKVPKIEVRP